MKFIYASKIVGAGIVSFVLLTVFSLVYKFTPSHVENTIGVTDYKWEQAAWVSTAEEGFSWLRVDSNGYNNIEAFGR